MKTIEQQISEDATGCREAARGIGVIYDDDGQPLDTAEAARAFLAGETIEVPNAGAGSYRAVFETLGAEDWDVFETCSSAGDWTLAVRYDGFWYPAWQHNRYPYHGFSYTLGAEDSFETKEDLFTWMANQ